ncbi:MAG: hypothetical protein IPO79_17110 [Flavobacteriales bacterium]|nr:hypothetical protein [Flavobacteriales bacterium]
METPMTPEQSLRLIESMIGQAKKSFSKLSFYFLMWGVLLTLAMFATYVLRDQPNAWGQGAPWGIAGILGGIVSAVHGARQGRREPVSNPMDGLIGWLWSSFVITMMIMIVVSVLERRDPGAMITLLTGIPTFMTGRSLRFRPLIIGRHPVLGRRDRHALQRRSAHADPALFRGHGARLHHPGPDAQTPGGCPSRRLIPSFTTSCGWRW